MTHMCVFGLSGLKGYRHNIIKVPLETSCDWLIAPNCGATIVPIAYAVRTNIFFRSYMQKWLFYSTIVLDVEAKPLPVRNIGKSYKICSFANWMQNKA